jgi:pilus assembly protein CpaF
MFGTRPNSTKRPFGRDGASDAAAPADPQPAPHQPVQRERPAVPAGAAMPRNPAVERTVRAAIGASRAPAPNSATDRRNKAAAPPVVTEIVSPASERYLAAKAALADAMFKTIDPEKIGQLTISEAEHEIRDVIGELVGIKDVSLSSAEQDRLAQDIIHDLLGYGPLQPLLERDDIADIMVNGADRVFIEVNGVVELTNVQFRDNTELLNICQRIVSAVGRRVDESSPICDARLPDGSRVNVILPPLGLNGPTLTIRKFKKDKLTLRKLVQFGAISPEGARLLAIIGRTRCNVLISGGTGSGKTTLLNTLTAFIDANERIVTCEDAAELQLQQPHVVSLETRPANLEGQGQIKMQDLVKNCLRMRPERIIIGEVRGPEAFDLLQAMNTGHDGSMGTLHANSPREALSRLESMITMGYNLNTRTVREMITGAVDVIIQTARLRDGSRRVTHVSEVMGLEGETIIVQDLFTYEIEGEDDDNSGRVIGKHVSAGIGRPKIWSKAKYYGLHKDLEQCLEA